MFSNFNISASGLTAQRLRMDVISGNIANVNTTRTENGTPYRRKIPVFKEKGSSNFYNTFKGLLGNQSQNGVEVDNIAEDNTPFKRKYQPEHPDADENGYVTLPNVNITTEMVDMIEASRAYEANVKALNTSKNMAMKALEIGKG